MREPKAYSINPGVWHKRRYIPNNAVRIGVYLRFNREMKIYG